MDEVEQQKDIPELENVEDKPEKQTNNENTFITIEEALTLTDFGIFNYILIVISGVILTAVFLETVGISYILTVSQCDLNLTSQRKGILSAMGFAGIITSSYLWGYLSDTIGRRKIIVPTLFISFVCSIASSLVNNFIAITILRFLTGFFVSGSSATIFAYLSEFHNNKYRAQAIMFASVIFGVTGATLPLIAWVVLNREFSFLIPLIMITYKPWRLFLLVCSLPSLISALVLLIYPESPKFLLGQTKQTETIVIINKMYMLNTKKKNNILEMTEIVQELETIEHRQMIEEGQKDGGNKILNLIWSQTKPLLKPPYLRSMLIACTLQFGVYMTDGVYIWFPEIVNKIVEYIERHPEERLTICESVYAGQLNNTITGDEDTVEIDWKQCSEKLELSTFKFGFILEAMYASGFGLIGLIINRISKFKIILFFFLLSGLSGVGAAYIQIPILGIILCVILIIIGIISSVISAVTVDLFPTNLRGMAVCISLMLGRCGSIVGSYIFGVYIDESCNWLFLCSGVLLIGCGGLSFFIPNVFRSTKKSESINFDAANDQT